MRQNADEKEEGSKKVTNTDSFIMMKKRLITIFSKQLPKRNIFLCLRPIELGVCGGFSLFQLPQKSNSSLFLSLFEGFSPPSIPYPDTLTVQKVSTFTGALSSGAKNVDWSWTATTNQATHYTMPFSFAFYEDLNFSLPNCSLFV